MSRNHLNEGNGSISADDSAGHRPPRDHSPRLSRPSKNGIGFWKGICQRCVFVGTKTALEWFCRLSWWDSPTQRARMRSGLLAANSGFMVGIGLFRGGFGGVCDGFCGDNNTGFLSLKPLDRSPDASLFRQRWFDSNGARERGEQACAITIRRARLVSPVTHDATRETTLPRNTRSDDSQHGIPVFCAVRHGFVPLWDKLSG